MCSFPSAGTFKSNVAAFGCSQCPAASFSNSSRASFCYVCQPGLLFWFDLIVIHRLNAGYIQPNAGSTACLPCAAYALPSLFAPDSRWRRGTFASTAGLTECSTCARGQVAANPGSSVCSNCQPGFALDLYRLSDSFFRYFADQVGQAVCTACAPGTFQVPYLLLPSL